MRLLIAVALAVLVYILLWRTSWGYRIRAVGQNPHASKYAGIKVKNYVVLALVLSGAFAGLAGAIQVYGLNFRMITDGSASGFTGSAGFNGIVAALFGQLHPIGTIPASTQGLPTSGILSTIFPHFSHFILTSSTQGLCGE